MDNIIKTTFENQMQEEALSIHRFENVPNNSVFKIETEMRAYIFKIYSSGWPEDGKLSFVNKKLNESNIPHAHLHAFSRDDGSDVNFPNGYLIEECLPGITADRLTLPISETLTLFEKLSALVSQVHKIKMTNYGYIGSGIAGWTTFSEFMYDSLKDNTSNLTAYHLFEQAELDIIGEVLYARLKVCDVYPAVLCHGDLSTKNILVHSDKITLIDWDDAQSLCWMADIARLTLWMRLHYDTETAHACRKAFLDRYETEYDKNTFCEMEDTLHVWYGLDMLNFYANSPFREKVSALLQDSRNKCGI